LFVFLKDYGRVMLWERAAMQQGTHKAKGRAEVAGKQTFHTCVKGFIIVSTLRFSTQAHQRK